MKDKEQKSENNFSVYCLTILDKEVEWCHWAKGLTMYINKNGVEIKLESEEVQKLVSSLPRTFGGRY